MINIILYIEYFQIVNLLFLKDELPICKRNILILSASHCSSFLNNSFWSSLHLSSKDFNWLSSLTFGNIFLTKLLLVTTARHSGQFICCSNRSFKQLAWKKWPQFRIETSLSNKLISPKHTEQLINISKSLKSNN